MKKLKNFIVPIASTLCIALVSNVSIADTEQITPDPLLQGLSKKAPVNNAAKINVSVKNKLSTSDKAQQLPDYLLGTYDKSNQQKANKKKLKAVKTRTFDTRNNSDYDLVTADPLLNSIR